MDPRTAAAFDIQKGGGAIAVAQINPTVGDLQGNTERIMEAARHLYAQGARLVLTPELAICGYPPEDLLLRPAFVHACEEQLDRLMHALAPLEGLYVVVGHPRALDGRDLHSSVRSGQPCCTNHASVLHEGLCVAHYAKRELPNYQVFDEHRYFAAGSAPCVFLARWGDVALKVGVLICEDAWFALPALQTQAQGAQLLVVLNASPYHVGKTTQRIEVMRACARRVGLPVIYAHCVGGQDEVVFEGESFALDAQGELIGKARAFGEDRWIVGAQKTEGTVCLEEQPCTDTQPSGGRGVRALSACGLGSLWHALVLGVRDYIHKNRFAGAILGLSGGVDSALVLAIAVDALGAHRVRAVMMPSVYTADISWIDAREMAGRLRVRYDEIPIEPAFAAFRTLLATAFSGLPEDATEENIQARIRGTLLMALSNKLGSIVLTTGNKSEMATGYCTLYGDMAGGFAVIKDVVKTTVFALANWRNAHDPYGTGSSPIPQRILTRAPSAELRPNQKDQDSLPPYEVLDEILQRYMEDNQSIAQIIAAGFEAQDVERVTRLIQVNEYKRRQAPVGIRVTHRSFGKDWRYPITNGFRQ